MLKINCLKLKKLSIKPKSNQIWLDLESNTVFKIIKIFSYTANYYTAMEFYGSNCSNDLILLLCCKKDDKLIYLKESMSSFGKNFIFIKNKGSL
jgi:hypothetical protein